MKATTTEVALRLRPEIPRTLENTARKRPWVGPLDHRGSEHTAHELCLADTLRCSPPGESHVNLRREIPARFLHNARLPSATRR
jgi:hypothetical protein